MALVSYSDSEESEIESKPATQIPAKQLPKSTKRQFHKVLDRSNPQKIKVNLPGVSETTTKLDRNDQEPPAKKAKVGTGAFGGFNSLLPAPKRTGVADKRGAPATGSSLKTGAAPGFSREPVAPEDQLEGKEEEEEEEEEEESNVAENPPEVAYSGEGGPASSEKLVTMNDNDATATSMPISAKKPMFKPLSVAKKPGKKKKSSYIEGSLSEGTTLRPTSKLTLQAQKSTLFPAGTETDNSTPELSVNEVYRPMLYQSKAQEDVSNGYSEPSNESNENYSNQEANVPIEPTSGANGQVQSLDSIAADLNLSASAKRQLFGRSRNNAEAINIVNFNTDNEYAANETLRQAGEQAQHNPVRAIAPGKHSLKQLVNAASNQRDALEEHFASGKRNKKEAGSKYGW